MIEEITRFTCPKCGEIIEFNSNKTGITVKDSGSVHNIDLGYVGYGSEYQDLDVKFDICDKCLVEWIDSFKIKPQFIADDDLQYERMKQAYDQCD